MDVCNWFFIPSKILSILKLYKLTSKALFIGEGILIKKNKFFVIEYI